MNYAMLAEIVQDTIERLVAAGVSRELVEREMKGVEWASLQDMTQANRDNQLLLCFKEHGSQACAERYGVSPRTVREWRQAAINRRQLRHSAAA